MSRHVSKKLQRSAQGQECTMQVVCFCNHSPDTTVLAHVQTEGGKMGGKESDFSAVFACAGCHAWLDHNIGSEEDRLFYTRRALVRTWAAWFSSGLVRVA